MNNLLIMMSGGTTSVINATVAGAIAGARTSSFINKVYGAVPGIVGVFNEAFLDLSNIDADSLKKSPGSALLGTTRVEKLTDLRLGILEDIFRRQGIGYILNIGGNGTIKQSASLSSFFPSLKIAAAPKTVDNDLGDEACEELWFTPGFPSCVNYWHHKMEMLNNESLGAHTHDKVIIAQAFGRKTGFITGAMRLFDPQRTLPLILLLPEDQCAPQDVLGKISDTLTKHDRVIIGICEGYEVGDYNFNYDKTGQEMYGSSRSSAVQELVNLCMDNKIQARGYNPTIDQRQNFDHTLDSDREISYDIGKEIINNFKLGHDHFFQSYSRKGLKLLPFSEVTSFSRSLQPKWVDFKNFDVTDKYIDYLESFINIL